MEATVDYRVTDNHGGTIHEPVVTGDPIVDADNIITKYDRHGVTIERIEWSNGAGIIYEGYDQTIRSNRPE